MPTEADKIKELEVKLSQYETNGSAKLFYALNKKANELADLLNRQSLANLDLADAKDKSFERLKVAWNEAASIAGAIKILGETAGITNDEEKDTKSPIFRITPETMADNIGELAGKKN